MKVGSWYLSECGGALGEFVETSPTDGDDVFMRLRHENGTIVKRTHPRPTFVPSIDVANPAERVLWSVPPEKQRVFVKGDPVFYLENGSYTLLPRRCTFAQYLNVNGVRMCEVTGHWGSRCVVDVCRIRSAKYLECDANCRRATLCWMLVSKRLGRLPKDMRRLIGQYVWESRDDKAWENRRVPVPPRRNPDRKAKKRIKKE